MEPKSSMTYQQCGGTELVESVKKIVYTNVIESNNINSRYLIFNNEIDQQNISDSIAPAMLEESNIYYAEQVNSEMNLQDLCRVCANVNSHMVPIFEDEGLQHDLAGKTLKYLPINVTKNDTLPLQLCYNCASTLIAWHELLEGCLDAEQKLLKIQERILSKNSAKFDVIEKSEVEQNTEIIQQSASYESNLVIQDLEHEKEHVPENSEAPSKQRFSFIQTRSVTSRCMKRDSISLDSLEEPAVEKINQEPENYSEDNDDSSDGLDDTQESTEDKDRNFEKSSNETDLKSGKKVDTAKKIKKNNEGSEIRQTRPRSYPCMYCDFVANKKKLLQSHMVEIHPDVPMDDLVKKPSCVDKEMIENARMEADGRVYYHCEDCGKNLFSPYTFFWHKRIHTGERPFCCHLCGKQFRVNQGLARHLHETHEGIKNFSCDICERTFATKRTLDDHRRIHTNERPYVCNRCGKTFKQKASLFVHNRTHSDVFPFKCIHCDQSFRTRPTLMVHITKHTGEKPHICDICSRPFRIKYELKRHKLVHSDEKPWQCSECGLSFRQKRYLVNHKRTNHGNESSVEK